MKSTLFSKGVLLAGTALVLGSSTTSFAASVQTDEAWTTIPGSACFAEDRANVSAFIAPASAGIMLKAGEPAQWVVCPVSRSGTTGTTSTAKTEAKHDITVVVDKASAGTALYCYSSLLESDGKSGVWTELHDVGTGEVGISISDAESGIQKLLGKAAGLSKPVDPATFTAATSDAVAAEGYLGALGVACLLSPGDKVVSITSVVVE